MESCDTMYPMKTCTNCGITKEYSEFNKRSSAKDGLQSHCKQCRKEKYAANPQPTRDRASTWRELNHERSISRARMWNAINSERKKASNKAWYERTKDDIKKRDQVERPGFATWSNNRKRAKKAGVAYHDKYTVEIGLVIQAIYNSPCSHCGSLEKVELDHIVSMAQGGSDLEDNWQPLCRSCNARKGAAARDLVGPALERERQRIMDGLTELNIEAEIFPQIRMLVFNSKEKVNG